MWNANTKKDEDCLYLNVWTKSKTAKMPVMVWIYGGGFYSGNQKLTNRLSLMVLGTASLDVYDGRIMADMGDVVVVSMNYRLDLSLDLAFDCSFSESVLLVSCHDWTIVLAIMQVYSTRDSR